MVNQLWMCKINAVTATKTVLIAEDSPVDLDRVLLTFKDVGIKNPIQVITDGSSVLQYFMGEGKYADRSTYSFPSVLLVNLRLPKSDGFEVLRILRDRGLSARLLKIVLTSHTDRMLLDRAYSLGANSFLSKPTKRDDLQNLVEFFKDYWVTPSSEV